MYLPLRKKGRFILQRACCPADSKVRVRLGCPSEMAGGAKACGRTAGGGVVEMAGACHGQGWGLEAMHV